MAEYVDEWAAYGKEYVWRPVRLAQLQSEGGAAGAVHGALQSGAFNHMHGISRITPDDSEYKISEEATANGISRQCLGCFSMRFPFLETTAIYMQPARAGFAMIALTVQFRRDGSGCVAHLAIKIKNSILAFSTDFALHTKF